MDMGMGCQPLDLLPRCDPKYLDRLQVRQECHRKDPHHQPKEGLPEVVGQTVEQAGEGTEELAGNCCW